MDLAEKGTVAGVNNLFCDLGLRGDKDDSYTVFSSFDHTIFTLGQAVWKNAGL